MLPASVELLLEYDVDATQHEWELDLDTLYNGVFVFFLFHCLYDNGIFSKGMPALAYIQLCNKNNCFLVAEVSAYNKRILLLYSGAHKGHGTDFHTELTDSLSNLAGLRKHILASFPMALCREAKRPERWFYQLFIYA